MRPQLYVFPGEREPRGGTKAGLLMIPMNAVQVSGLVPNRKKRLRHGTSMRLLGWSSRLINIEPRTLPSLDASADEIFSFVQGGEFELRLQLIIMVGAIITLQIGLTILHIPTKNYPSPRHVVDLRAICVT